MVYLSRTIDGGFKDDETSGFQIKCGDRIFHVHRVVLRQDYYFDKILSGGWKEAHDGSLDFSHWQPVIVEAILRRLYGQDYLDMSHLLQGSADLISPGSEASSDTLIPVPSARSEDKHALLLDPNRALAKFHCHELRNHVKVYVMADYYEDVDHMDDHRQAMTTIGYEAAKAFMAVVADCWNAPEIMEVMQLVYEVIPEDVYLLNNFVDEIMRRVPMLLGSDLFHSFLGKVPALAVNLLTKSLEYDFVLPTDPETRYCSYHKCRTNVRTTFKVARQRCSLCGREDALMPAKTRLWDEETEREYLNMVDEE